MFCRQCVLETVQDRGWFWKPPSLLSVARPGVAGFGLQRRLKADSTRSCVFSLRGVLSGDKKKLLNRSLRIIGDRWQSPRCVLEALLNEATNRARILEWEGDAGGLSCRQARWIKRTR